MSDSHAMFRSQRLTAFLPISQLSHFLPPLSLLFPELLLEKVDVDVPAMAELWLSLILSTLASVSLCINYGPLP